MQIDLDRLSAESETFEGVDPAAILELEQDEFYRGREPIRYGLRALVVSDELIVTGRVETEVDFWCSRCGERCGLKVEEPAFERVFDLNSEDTPRVPDQPQSVDLTADIREATILTFPAYPVCRAECRGLCPTCGTNLNTGACGCKLPVDKRWDMLDKVRLD